MGFNIFASAASGGGVGAGVAFNNKRPNTIVFPPTRTIAVGRGTNTIAYSSNGITWTGLGVISPTTPFTTAGYGVAWNGKLWVAVGEGTNTIAYSSDGITWTGLGVISPTTPFTTAGRGVAYGQDVLGAGLWVAVGDGTCLLYTSPSPRDRQKSRMPSSA